MQKGQRYWGTGGRQRRRRESKRIRKTGPGWLNKKKGAGKENHG